MTYTSGSPYPMTPEAKLADKRWRYTNSWWIFPSLLSCGFLGWLGFMVAAIRTGKKSYWLFCALYALVFAAFMVLISVGPKDGLVYNLGTAPFLVAWLAPTIHAAILNRSYLRALAFKGDWYRAPMSQPTQPVQQEPVPFLGVSQSDFYAPTASTFELNQPKPREQSRDSAASRETQTPRTHAADVSPTSASSPSPVDANTATVETLTQLPGVDLALAHRVVAIRDARGAYRDIDDLAAAANLQPHELVRLRSQLTFDKQNPNKSQTHNPTQHGGTGRILDI